MPQSLEAVFREFRSLRQEDRGRDLTSHITALLLRPWDEDEARALRGELIGELQRRNRFTEAEELLRIECKREPDEPYHSLSLAEHFHYYDVDLGESLKHVAEAVGKAEADGKFMYQALGIQARLAIETQSWSLLADTLRKLTAYEHTPGNTDVFPETDFLARIPPGTVPEALISAYTERVEYLRSIEYSTLLGPRIP